MKLTQTQIKLNSILLHGYHGISAEEQQVGSDFQIDISISISANVEDLQNDDLDNSINYAEAFQIVKTVFKQTSCTLEHVCTRIIQALFEHFSLAQQITVEVHKLNPPMGADCKSASVQITATK